LIYLFAPFVPFCGYPFHIFCLFSTNAKIKGQL